MNFLRSTTLSSSVLLTLLTSGCGLARDSSLVDLVPAPVASISEKTVVEVVPCVLGDEMSREPKAGAFETPISGGFLNERIVCGELPNFDPKAYEPGEIVVEVVFDTEGDPVRVRSSEKNTSLRDAALYAAKQSWISPPRYLGEPVNIQGFVIYRHTPEDGIWIPRSLYAN